MDVRVPLREQSGLATQSKGVWSNTEDTVGLAPKANQALPAHASGPRVGRGSGTGAGQAVGPG